MNLNRRNHSPEHGIRVPFDELKKRVVALLEAAGMTIEAVFGGFEGEPYDLRHDRMLILARVMERQHS